MVSSPVMGSGEHGWGSAMTNDNDGYTPIAGWFLLMLVMLDNVPKNVSNVR